MDEIKEPKIGDEDIPFEMKIGMNLKDAKKEEPSDEKPVVIEIGMNLKDAKYDPEDTTDEEKEIEEPGCPVFRGETGYILGKTLK